MIVTARINGCQLLESFPKHQCFIQGFDGLLSDLILFLAGQTSVDFPTFVL